ncbi:YdeI/OmpD-associated family protein [Negadavirga shengliensis]|uniref:YdeI/OmpD-associated family protein n=1 Tax=Negadavirga shengliensis TaxID=1389218 RepID=A0ABV9SWU4_9BACT
MEKTKTFTTTLENFHSNLWQHHLPVPEDIATFFIEGDNRRVLCQVNGLEGFHTALMKCRDYWYILLNKALKDKLDIYEGDKVHVFLEKDRTTYGHGMPEELQALLDQDEEGNRHFKALTMGKQRSLIYIVNKVKSSPSRLNKALAIVHHLKDANGKLDFRKLNEKIKYYNNLERGK